MRRAIILALTTACALTAALLWMTPVRAAFFASPLDHRAAYAVTIAGIEIGDAALLVRTDEAGYAVEVTGGFRFLFWSGAAEAESLGAREAAGFAPNRYRSRFESPMRIFTTAIDFGGGAPEGRWRAEPPLEGDGFEDRVPITEADLKGAKDPLSAFLIPAETGREACAQSLKVFSGVVRFDVDLRLIEEAPDGVVDCLGAYRPVAGHRRVSGEVSRLERDGLRVALFELAPGLWAPERLGFSTRFGTLAIVRR